MNEAALDAKLRRRLAALASALANPVPLARRLLRQRMKPRTARATLPYFRPPGIRARALGAPDLQLFHGLNDLALRLELAAPDSS